MKRLLIALLLLCPVAAFAAPTNVQLGVDRTVNPWQVCVYDNASTPVCQPTFSVALTGGGVTWLGAVPLSTVTGLGANVATMLGLATNVSGGPATYPVAQSTLSGLGTGVSTALGVNVGTAGAFVVNGGALGTPSSGTLTNATGLPISTGVSGLGTGVSAALGIAVNTTGGIATYPVAQSTLSGLGTGVSTALGNTAGANGGFAINGGTNAGDTTWSGTFNETSPPNLSATLIANGFSPSYSAHQLNTATAHASGWEGALNIGLTINHGSNASGGSLSGSADKVGLYVGVICNTAATGDACVAGWAENPVLTLQGAALAPNFTAVQVRESDMNINVATLFGSYTGAFNPAQYCPGLSTVNQCYVGNTTITGYSTGGSADYGLLVSGFRSAGGGMYQRGIVVNSAIQHAFEDASSAVTSFAIYGSHTIGIDLNGGSFGAAALRLGNVGVISARNAANTADIQLMYLDSGNNFEIMPGASSTGYVVIGSYSAGLVPGATGAQALGNPTNIWAGAYVTDLYTNDASYLIRTKTSLTNRSGANTATLSNAPAAGNPTKWISIDDNGTSREIPTW